MVSSDLARRLADISHQLRTLTVSTSDSFLTLGSNLREFYVVAKDIVQESTTAAAYLTGEELSTPVVALRELEEKLNHCLDQSERFSQKSNASFREIQTRVASMSKPIAGFQKIVRTLHILGVSTRIENASLTSCKDDFKLLSERVNELAAIIESKVDVILAHSEALRSGIEMTLVEITSLKRRQYSELRDVMDNVSSKLDLLSTKQSDSCQVVDGLSQKSKQIYSNMSTMISSMQFHDITRQQIEHVVDALENLSADLESQPPGEGPDQSIFAGRVNKVCKLQRVQIGHACQSLTTEIERLFDGLRGIERISDDLSREICELVGCGDDEGSSFLEQLHDDFTHLTKSLRRNSEKSKKMAASIDQMTDSILEMTKFLKDIESIGFEIEMISLNAIVKSSNLGSDGKALTVLAESIKRLSEDASVEVLKISQAFEEIGAAAAVLKKTADKGSKALFGEINSLHDDLSSVLSTMGAADKHVGESLFQINLQAKALSKDSERQITNFQAHHTYRSVLLKTSAELMKIIGQTNAAADAHTAGDMQELSTRYTMDSERALHRTILSADIESGQAEKPPAVEEALVGSSDKDDFGDNIQLF